MFIVLIYSWAVVRSKKLYFVCSGVLVISIIFTSKRSVTWASVKVLEISGGESVFSMMSSDAIFVWPLMQKKFLLHFPTYSLSFVELFLQLVTL